MKTLYFLDTKATYALDNNTITQLDRYKKRCFDIISLEPNALLHSSIEIDKKDSSKIPTLLYAKARQKGILTLLDESYTHYFCEREHLFDEQKCVYESFFYAKDKNLKSRIITSDIFLPLALPCYNDFIVLIPPYLCYFENTTFKEALKIETLSSIDSNTHLYENLISLIAYLQEAYHKDFDTLYYFTDKQSLLDSLLTYNATNTAQSLPTLLPLSHITEQSKNLDFYALRAYLGFEYALKHKANLQSSHKSHLPNFTPQPSTYARFFPLLLVCIALFVFIIPIALKFYNHHLQSQITALNTQNEMLFSTYARFFPLLLVCIALFVFIIPIALKFYNHHLQSQITALNTQNEMLFAPPDSFSQAQDIHTLTLRHTALSHTLQELESWQRDYPKRYAFMESIFSQCATNDIQLESVSFAFAQSHFVATLRLKSSSKLGTSAFLAKLNSNTQYAFLQQSLDSTESSTHTQHTSHIIVVQNVL